MVIAQNYNYLIKPEYVRECHDILNKWYISRCIYTKMAIAYFSENKPGNSLNMNEWHLCYEERWEKEKRGKKKSFFRSPSQ